MATRSSKKRSGGGTTHSRKAHKYIFVIGGVMSGVGKGIATSSIALILSAKGYRVNNVKVDPYLNVDAGTMNPTEHGEVFVLESGLETDQDMGNYERFLGRSLGPEDYMTGGMIYQHVINRERNLGFKGKCVEAIPHVRDEIMRRYRAAGEAGRSDITVVEIGGTVGDFQNALFIEAVRALKTEHPGDVMVALVSYLPVPGTLGEMKTRPTQHAIQQLYAYGIAPDVIIARAPVALDARRKEKIAAASGLTPEAIISAPDVDSIYDVPLNFDKENVGSTILKKLALPDRTASLAEWKKFVAHTHNGTRDVKIAIVGKYFDTGDFVLTDAYLSVIEAIKFSAAALSVRAQVTWVNAKDFEKKPTSVTLLDEYDGVIVPGGFGETGIEGKILAIRHVREHQIPFFGLCYGMQLMTVEYARHVANLKDAHTVEIHPKTPHPVIDVMPDQKKIIADERYGGTMRLGHYPAILKKGSIAAEAYGEKRVNERHRHRYEVNPAYIKMLEEAGLVFSAHSPDGILMEVAELPREVHPFMLGTQFHPELQARPLAPHPLFTAFLKAAAGKK